jgi:hypothetical protein
LHQADGAIVDLCLQVGNVACVAAQRRVDRGKSAADIVVGDALDHVARRDHLAVGVERGAERGGDALVGGIELPAIDRVGRSGRDRAGGKVDQLALAADRADRYRVGSIGDRTFAKRDSVRCSRPGARPESEAVATGRLCILAERRRIA